MSSYVTQNQPASTALFNSSSFSNISSALTSSASPLPSPSSSVSSPQSYSGGFSTTWSTQSSSSWLVLRLFSALTKAVLDQANEMTLQHQKSIQNIHECISTEGLKQQIQDLDVNRASLNFNYFVSPYAGVCMIMAILLNRTIVFASSRSSNNTRRKNLPRFLKFFLRSVSIGLILRMVLQVFYQFIVYSPALNTLASPFIDVPSSSSILKIDTLLWQVFLTLCFSQFLETFVSIASSQLPSNDTALTLFEQSLAFQESQFLKQPSIQLLIIVAFSLINQLTIQIVGLTNMKKYQLIPSTVTGVAFLFYYILNLYTGELIHFPYVVILTMIPQLLVLAVTSFCLSVYGLAVWINGSSDGLAYTPMMKNLKDSLNLQFNDDFNSVLMRFGSIVFNAADNEDYVNEYSPLSMTEKTYLDNDVGNCDDDDDDDQLYGTSHLLSGYFNKVENYPEALQTFENQASSNLSLSNSWLLAEKYSNLFKLLHGIFKFCYRSLFTSRSKSSSEPSSLSVSPTSTLYAVQSINSLFPDYPSSLPQHTTNPETETTFLDDNIEIDNSEDFQYYSESDNEPLEYVSDLEEAEQVEYLATLSSLRESQTPQSLLKQSNSKNVSKFRESSKPSPVNELFRGEDFAKLISPSNLEDISTLNNIRVHLLKDSRITRSLYAEINQDNLLREVILQNRMAKPLRYGHKNAFNNGTNTTTINNDEDESESLDSPCVVCQTNQRSIILWPCKCFALCEACRVNLGVRGFKFCICCRRSVEGFSKVYVP